MTCSRFAATNLNKNAGGKDYPKLVEAIERDDRKRAAFLKRCLTKLGLDASDDNGVVPTLSMLHLSSIHPPDVGKLVGRLKEMSVIEDSGRQKIVGENDTFILQRAPGPLSMTSIADSLPADSDSPHKIIDYNKVVKYIQVHDDLIPRSQETPYFNHKTYFDSLRHYRSQSRSFPEQFGTFILYGEVVTSTNTILEKYSLPPLLTSAQRLER